ncbi:MAG: PDZ domain-containing protein [Nitrospirota bacterium]|nr:MAG: PDZ domain-containing protein [Nitrospirota bacterium]
MKTPIIKNIPKIPKHLKVRDRLRSIAFLVFVMSLVWAVPVSAEEMTPSPSSPHQVYPSDSSLPRGIIGVAIHLSAHRVGDPARLYIRAIHPEGPAAKVGLEHGDEILAVNGNSLNGKTYEQIIRLIRGDIGETVRLQVNGARGNREVTVPRISEETLTGKKRT